MSAWLTIPSKRPPEEAEKVLKLWRERGYKIALMVDNRADIDAMAPFCDEIMAHADGYQGYAQSVNHLIGYVAVKFPNVEWFIAAGDDVEPDLNHSAEEIARQCGRHFWEARELPSSGVWKEWPSMGGGWYTFGVMQPTGDRWGDRNDGKGAYIDRVCGSAWIGREFAQRVNQGRGPLWPEYQHMYVDEELQHVAQKYGVLWQRPDLTQIHRHWGRGPDTNPNQLQDRDKAMPDFLKEANSAEHWRKYKALFEQRKAAGFPGSELA